MQEYKCTVKKGDGTIVKNYRIKAEDGTELNQKIKSNGFYLLTFQEIQSRKDSGGGSKIKLSMKDISMLTRQLSSMLTAGVTLVKALNILYLQIEKKNIKESIKRLYESVQKGGQLSEAMINQSGVYPELMVSMIEAGEASGKLDSVSVKLAEHFEKDVKLKAKIKTAMTYPIILASLTVAVVLILVTQVLPIFISMFTGSGMTLPLPTRIVMGFSAILTGYWYVVLIAIVGIALAFRAYISTDTGRMNWDTFQMKMPLIGSTITKISAVRFSRTLSTLLGSGMTLLQALEIVIKVVGNRKVMEGLMITREDIRKGISLSNSLRKVDVFPPMVYSMIGIGEESGTMEKMLEKCAEYYDDEVENAIQKLVSMIEPLLIITMGVVVGFIIVSIMLPIFDIYGSIK